MTPSGSSCWTTGSTAPARAQTTSLPACAGRRQRHGRHGRNGRHGPRLHGRHGHGWHGHGWHGRGAQSPLLGGAGDVVYPHYLVNGRVPAAPVTLQGKPGQRVRIRMVNAGSDTAFRWRSAATGSPSPTATASRWPGRHGRPPHRNGRALRRAGHPRRRGVPARRVGRGQVGPGTGRRPHRGRSATRCRRGAPRVLTRTVRLGSDLRAAPEVRLRRQGVDRTHDFVLGGSMAGYRWTINGKTFDEADPLEVRQARGCARGCAT